MTNTQEIEQIEVLVNALPRFQFHIAALTEMGERLVRLNDYPNVHLYPGISGENYERLLDKCRIYLDIAYANEILDGNRMALEKGMILYAFEETCHRPNVYTKDHLFPLQTCSMNYLSWKILKNINQPMISKRCIRR